MLLHRHTKMTARFLVLIIADVTTTHTFCSGTVAQFIPSFLRKSLLAFFLNFDSLYLGNKTKLYKKIILEPFSAY